MGTVIPTWNDRVNECLRHLSPGSVSSSSKRCCFPLGDIELESVMSVRASVFAPEITHTQLHELFSSVARRTISGTMEFEVL